MSAAALWIYLPIAAGLMLILTAGNRRFSLIFSMLLTLLLSYTAFSIPVNSMIVMNKITIIFTASGKLLGSAVTIDRADQTLVAFFYIFTFLWIVGSLFISEPHPYFFSIALISTALIIGVIVVKPFVYGIYIMAGCTVILLPLLSRGDENREELFRFICCQFFGMIFLSFSAKLMTTVDINPQDTYLLKRTVILLFIGLTLWLAVFPFHSWIVMLIGKSQPFASGFVISLLQFSALFILLQFLADHIWLRAYQPFFVGMRVAGMLMLIVGALLSLVQTDLRRLTAFFITAVNGVSLLTLGLASRSGIETFISLLPLNMIVWFINAASAQMIADSHGLTIPELRGLFRTRPYLCAALVLAFLTAGGMPLLAGFPLHMTMLSDAYARSSALGWAAAAGCSLMIFGGVRLALVFLSPGVEAEDPGVAALSRREKAARKAFFIACIAILVILAIFPDIINGLVGGINSQYAYIFQ